MSGAAPDLNTLCLAVVAVAFVAGAIAGRLRRARWR